MTDKEIKGRLDQAESPGDGKTQRDLLIACARDAELWHDGDGMGFASVAVHHHRENYRIRSRHFRDWLGRRYYQRHGSAPGGQGTEDALRIIEAKARYDGPARQPALRIAADGNAIFLDIVGDDWAAVEVTADGWQIVEVPPVKFIRSRGMRPLFMPEKGGSIDDLHQYVNVSGDRDFLLMVAWLLAALKPEGPYPILVLNGEQGSAKSTVARILRELVDPNVAPIRTAPRDERDLLIAALNGWVIAPDNLSSIAPWFSDALCRLATGGGFGTRQLYSDTDEVLFEAQRPIILNGIPDLASRPDLADRALVLTLPQIGDDRRLDEKQLWQNFHAAAGKILGALLDAVSVALRRKDSVKLARLPRMADFALWVTAAEPGCGWPDGSFMEAYTDNRAIAVEDAVEADPVATAIRSFASETGWTGTATELLAILNERDVDAVRHPRFWPPDAPRLSNRVRRAAPGLRALGVEVDMDVREGHERRRLIAIRKKGQNTVSTVRTVRKVNKSSKNNGSGEEECGRYADGDENLLSAPNPLKNKAVNVADAADGDLPLYSSSSWERSL